MFSIFTKKLINIPNFSEGYFMVCTMNFYEAMKV